MQEIFSRSEMSTNFLGNIKKKTAVDYVKEHITLYFDNQLNKVEKEKFEKIINDYPEANNMYQSQKKIREEILRKIPKVSLSYEEKSDLTIELSEIYQSLRVKEKRKDENLLDKINSVIAQFLG